MTEQQTGYDGGYERGYVHELGCRMRVLLTLTLSSLTGSVPAPRAACFPFWVALEVAALTVACSVQPDADPTTSSIPLRGARGVPTGDPARTLSGG